MHARHACRLFATAASSSIVAWACACTHASTPSSAGASASPVSSPAQLHPAGDASAVPSAAGPPGQPVSLPGGAIGWMQSPPSAPGGKRAAVVVVQEWWGLNDWIKQDVARFAGEGYVALAVDLYRGKVAADPGEAHELMRGLPEDRALGDLRAGFDWLAAREDVDPRRIGVVGWCMGGGYALAFAVAEPRLAAAVVNYGKLVTAPEKIAAIHAPLLGNFAGLDRGISPEDVRAFGEKLKAERKDADIKVYDDAKHAFMNPNDSNGYNAAAARDAWARIDAFFARTLGK